jgi:hypothetical protein
MRAHEFVSRTVADVNTAKSIAQDLDRAVDDLGQMIEAEQSGPSAVRLRQRIQDLYQELTDMGFQYVGGTELVRVKPVTEKKDACYHKVRSRYKVWPSAYASGALVQCRKRGAKNWGNRTK